MIGLGLGLTRGGGGPPAGAYASYPAPDGFRWAYVTSRGAMVYSGGEPVVALVRI